MRVCPSEELSSVGWIRSWRANRERVIRHKETDSSSTSAQLLIIMLSISWSESYWEALLKFSSNEICMLHAAPALHMHTKLTFAYPRVRLLPTQSICDSVAFRSRTVQLDADKALENEQNVKQTRNGQTDTSARSVWGFQWLLTILMSRDHKMSKHLRSKQPSLAAAGRC